MRQSCGNHRADARPWPGAGPAGLIPQPVEPQRCASGLLLQARKGLEALVQFGLHDVVLSTDLEQQKRLCRFSRQARGLRDHQKLFETPLRQSEFDEVDRQIADN